MSTTKAVPKALRCIECKYGMWGKNSPICYITEQDTIQDTLETKAKTTSFMLTLPGTGKEMRLAIWASGIPKDFFKYMCGVTHIIIKQIRPVPLSSRTPSMYN